MRHTAQTSLSLFVLFGLILATACQSAPEPRKDTPKLRSGSEIATSTGDQTRAALKKEPGLVLYASSIPDEPEQETPEKTEPSESKPVEPEPTSSENSPAEEPDTTDAVNPDETPTAKDGKDTETGATARVTVYSKPKGAIVLDGNDTGKQTPSTISTEAGAHKIQVRFESGELSEPKTVRVENGKRIKLFFRESGEASKDEGEDKNKDAKAPAKP